MSRQTWEEKVERSWREYGDIAGELIEQYNDKFMALVEKYGKGYDIDELYSEYVLYRLPIYIDNWNPIKQRNIFSWVCYCIYLSIKRHVSRSSSDEVMSLEENLDFFRPICDQRGIYYIEGVCSCRLEKAAEHAYDSLSQHEKYLIERCVIQGESLRSVARANNCTHVKIRDDLNRALHKCRLSIRIETRDD